MYQKKNKFHKSYKITYIKTIKGRRTKNMHSHFYNRYEIWSRLFVAVPVGAYALAYRNIEKKNSHKISWSNRLHDRNCLFFYILFGSAENFHKNERYI